MVMDRPTNYALFSRYFIRYDSIYVRSKADEMASLV